MLGKLIPIPTVVAASKGASADTPAMRKCNANATTCVETYTIAFAYFDSAATSLSAPGWITTTGSSSTMSIAPAVSN